MGDGEQGIRRREKERLWARQKGEPQREQEGWTQGRGTITQSQTHALKEQIVASLAKVDPLRRLRLRESTRCDPRSRKRHLSSNLPHSSEDQSAAIVFISCSSKEALLSRAATMQHRVVVRNLRARPRVM